MRDFTLESVAELDEVEGKALRLLQAVGQVSGGAGDPVPIARDVRYKLEVVLQLAEIARAEKQKPTTHDSLEWLLADAPECRDTLLAGWDDDPATWGALLGWLFVHDLGRIAGEADFDQRSRSGIDEWLLGRIIAGALRDFGLDEMAAARVVTAIRILTAHQRWFAGHAPTEAWAYRTLDSWLRDDEVRRFIQVNRYQDVLWFNHESFEQLLWWMLAAAVISILADPARTGAEASNAIQACCEVVTALQAAEEQSGYQVERLLEAARSESGLL
jgi:hypothetical protein